MTERLIFKISESSSPEQGKQSLNTVLDLQIQTTSLYDHKYNTQHTPAISSLFAQCIDHMTPDHTPTTEYTSPSNKPFSFSDELPEQLNSSMNSIQDKFNRQKVKRKRLRESGSLSGVIPPKGNDNRPRSGQKKPTNIANKFIFFNVMNARLQFLLHFQKAMFFWSLVDDDYEGKHTCEKPTTHTSSCICINEHQQHEQFLIAN